MIPENRLSTSPVLADYLDPDDRFDDPLIDYEMGGIALNDASMGLNYQVWIAIYDGAAIRVKPQGASGLGTVVVTADGIEWIGFSFDRNMQPAVAYVIGTTTYFLWYDTVTHTYATTTYAGARTPRVTHDDKRDTSINTSDVLLFYLVGGELRYRQQRDRYAVERVLTTGLSTGSAIARVGMTTANRLQIEVL